MKQKIRILLTQDALVMATTLQTRRGHTLSQIIEDCVRQTYALEAGRLKNDINK